MVEAMGVGVIGCGNISATYLKSSKTFPLLDIRAVADLNPDASRVRADEFGVAALDVDSLLSDPAIELVINLTTPQAHVDVSLSAIARGKHVYSEKPLGLTSAEAARLLDTADRANRQVGCAPDTFLGGAHQTCRKLIDEGAIGRPIAGTAFFMWPGHERWHPSPGFYYLEGGGPILDMGPYYITVLVNLLGPVARVVGFTSRPQDTRLVTSQPLFGTRLPVEVDTHAAGLLRFRNGAIVTLTMSFDIEQHRHTPLELYGAAGSMILPDPDGFGGDIQLAVGQSAWTAISPELPFTDHYTRIIGAADMAQAIREGRPHRASGALAAHVLEVIEATASSSSTGAAIDIQTAPPRPAPLGPKELMLRLEA